MYAIEFARLAVIRAGADREDLHWHQCLTTYGSYQEAEEDMKWMEAEDPAFEYRIVPLLDSEPANDNGEDP